MEDWAPGSLVSGKAVLNCDLTRGLGLGIPLV